MISIFCKKNLKAFAIVTNILGEIDDYIKISKKNDREIFILNWIKPIVTQKMKAYFHSSFSKRTNLAKDESC